MTFVVFATLRVVTAVFLKDTLLGWVCSMFNYLFLFFPVLPRALGGSIQSTKKFDIGRLHVFHRSGSGVVIVLFLPGTFRCIVVHALLGFIPIILTN